MGIDYPEAVESGTVNDLQPDKKPNLQLITDTYEIHRICDMLGVDYDPDSIMRTDDWGCAWVDTSGGEYSEVWLCHYSVPYLSKDVIRVR